MDKTLHDLQRLPYHHPNFTDAQQHWLYQCLINHPTSPQRCSCLHQYPQNHFPPSPRILQVIEHYRKIYIIINKSSQQVSGRLPTVAGARHWSVTRTYLPQSSNVGSCGGAVDPLWVYSFLTHNAGCLASSRVLGFYSARTWGGGFGCSSRILMISPQCCLLKWYHRQFQVQEDPGQPEKGQGHRFVVHSKITS